MATIGNLASTQVMMAQVATRYGVSGSNLYNSTLNSGTSSVKSYKQTAADELDNILKTTLKNESDYFKEQYSSLYKSIFGISDDVEQVAESTTTLKAATVATEDAAGKLESFASGLEYGGEYDADAFTKTVEKFVESYNSMIDKTADSDNQSVLQKGVVMVNTAKVYSGSLKRVGISVGSDNKLSFNKDKLSEISATDIKTTFGRYGFASKSAQKAQQIGRLAGSMGTFSYTNASTQSYAYSMGALLNTYA